VGQVARVTKFYTVAPNICGSSVWNLLLVTRLVPRILRRLLDFWTVCGTMRYSTRGLREMKYLGKL
jgi:hypothetical protein